VCVCVCDTYNTNEPTALGSSSSARPSCARALPSAPGRSHLGGSEDHGVVPRIAMLPGKMVRNHWI
jgi:hypothetical protein